MLENTLLYKCLRELSEKKKREVYTILDCGCPSLGKRVQIYPLADFIFLFFPFFFVADEFVDD